MKLNEQGLRKIINAFGIKNEVFFANKINRVAQIDFKQDDFKGSAVPKPQKEPPNPSSGVRRIVLG